MKVLVVTNTYPPADISGVGSLAAELRAGLAGQADIEVLTRRGPREAGVRSTGGGKLWFPVRASLASLAGRDVVHVNESDGVLLAIRIALLRALGLVAPRLAVTFQVSYFTEAREVRVLRDGDRVVSRPTSSELIFKLLRAPLHALAGVITARCADAVVACSEYTAREIARDYGVEPAPRAIPNGLAHVDAAPAAPATGDDGVVRALYAGRLRTRKAVAILLEALARPETRAVTLTIVGDGEQRAALEARAADLGLGERCTFVGLVPRDDIARRYAEADLFVLPSTYEGFPVAILEAMAAGLPIVATRVAGIPEAVEHGTSGLLIEREDADALARALGQLAADRDRRREMGAAARRAVLERFTIERVGRDYLELWRSLSSREATA